ncbi:GNAT family N-acetyltransferase [Rhodococcoides yunnanense]|uniref:GNAT family N-acetyltransferase n=1 Tax=Rhodococcoides yunnanense TaxID=278209 RepID=UPI0009349E98|nr:GNAT family N-acetyltransferase [Rhodococcus yunnanensis]
MNASTPTLVPMDSAQIRRWLDSGRAQYVADRIEAGESRSEAEANALASYSSTFPGDIPSPTQRLFDVVLASEVVGCLWLAPRADAEPDHWWVWDIEIEENFRGRGLGRATMLLAEDAARAEGAKTLGLNVFGGNAVARQLYRSLDYRETAVQMRKNL